MFFWCKASIHILCSTASAAVFWNTAWDISPAFFSVNCWLYLLWIWISKYFPCPLASQELFFLTKHPAEILLLQMFLHTFRRSLYQVRDSYSIWEIDSIYLWYFYWIQPFSEVLFARFHLQVLCFRKIYLSVLPSVILFRLTSDKYFSSGFPFQIIYGSAALWFSSFLSDCSVFLYSYPCIRSFLQEIRFLSLPHIDGCDSTFPMDSPSPFSFFHPFHVTFIYAMNWMIFFCAFLV